MRLELDWHIPWPADWDPGRKQRAAEKLVEYLTQGTMYEAKSRMRVTDAEVRPIRPDPQATPTVHLTLEN